MASDPFDFSDVFADLEKKIDGLMRSDNMHKMLSLSCKDATWDLVYEKYVPHGRWIWYTKPGYPISRRYDNGGLMDPDNYPVTNPDKMTMEVSNETKGNPYWRPPMSEGWDPGYINDIIEKGVGYNWSDSDIYQMEPYPRPFMAEAVDMFTDRTLLPEIHNRFFND